MRIKEVAKAVGLHNRMSTGMVGVQGEENFGTKTKVEC